MKTHNGKPGGSKVSADRAFGEYLAIVVREKWIILTVLIVMVVGTLLYTKLTDPVFQATCQVLLSQAEAKASIFDPARTEMKTVTQNELAILNSRALADSVAARLHGRRYLDDAKTQIMPVLRPEKDAIGPDSLAPVELISGRVQNAIDFDPVRDSDIIRIIAKSKNAVEAALIANTYAEAYQARNIYLSRSKTRAFREFLAEQMRDRRKALEETESSLQDYMERQEIVSLDDEARRMIDQLAELEARRDETDIDLRRLQSQLASYQEQLPQQETNVARVVGEASDTYIKQMQEQLARLEVQRDVTVVQNPSSVGREILNERVREIDAQINALRLKLQKRTDDFLRTLTPAEGGVSDAAGYLKSLKQKMVETDMQVSSLQAKKRALNDAIAEYEAKFNKIPGKSVALARLQRARVSNEKLYLMVEEKFNEANINEQSNIGYIEIIERAGIPRQPSSPKPLINLGIGVVLGLLLGFAFAFVKEYVDVRVHTPEDLKRKGYSLLTTIMNMDLEINRLGGPKIAAKEKGLDPHLITLSFPFSSVAEAYRQMRTNLQYAKTGHPVRSILVTSPVPADGKTTTACNLGIAFAQTGKRVLLVDADLRRPTLDAQFSLPKGPGLSELLAGQAQFHPIVQRTKVDNLHVLISGEIPPNPAEVLGSDQMRRFIETITREYDQIIFDASPVLAVTDPAVVSTMVDGTIMVISAGRTRQTDLDQATEILEGVGGKVIGVVMNNFDPHLAYGIPVQRGHRQRYGYGRTYYGRKGNGTPEETPVAHQEKNS